MPIGGTLTVSRWPGELPSTVDAPGTRATVLEVVALGPRGCAGRPEYLTPAREATGASITSEANLSVRHQAWVKTGGRAANDSCCTRLVCPTCTRLTGLHRVAYRDTNHTEFARLPPRTVGKRCPQAHLGHRLSTYG